MNKIIMDFIHNVCVIEVSNAKGFEKFKTLMKENNLYEDFFRNKDSEKISYWRHLAEINDERLYGKRWLRPYFPLYFEYQYDKGGTFDWDRKSVIGWYGSECVIPVDLI